MSYKELAKRLRGDCACDACITNYAVCLAPAEAADALEAQARRIEELEARLRLAEMKSVDVPGAI